MIESNLEPQDRQVEQAELASQLNTALRGLDPKCRELIKLRYYNELPFGEIARRVGVTENTLTVQTRRCLDKLRAAYHNLERKGIRR